MTTTTPRAGVRRTAPERPWWLHLVHPAALLPLGLLVADAALGRLTVNPIQDVTLRTGWAALLLLVLSLACTPLQLLGLRWARQLRRPLGLYAFGYAALHMLVFVAVDFGFDMDLILREVAEKRYVLAGLAALLLLTPLALTSTKGWQRRLGRRWTQLHRLVYLAAPLAVVHYLWLVKADYRDPLLFAGALALLLALRLPPVRRRLARGRGRSPTTP